MGNKCSLCMNCEYKGRGNFIPPCRFCNDCSEFKNVLLDSIPKKQGRKNSMGNISDVYCKKCKNNPYGCATCTVHEPFEGSPEGGYISYAPTKFVPTTRIPAEYEKIFNEKVYNRNMSWIADMVDNIGFDISIVKIEKIIFSGPATIVLWKGGGKTIVKYHKEKGCAYRKDLGVLYCIVKHYLCLDNAKLFHKFLKTIDEFCKEPKT